MQDPAQHSLVVQAGGQMIGDLFVQTVMSPAAPGRLVLETWDGENSAMMENMSEAGITYLPPSITPGLMNGLRFPSASKPLASAAQLISRVREFLTKYAFLVADVPDLLVAFVLASWFSDLTPVAPVLHLTGADDSVRVVLHLLGLLCRYPIVLGDADFPALATLPPRLGATLLIEERHVSRRVMDVLQASNRREFQVHRGRRSVDIYGAKVFACEAPPAAGEGSGLSVSLPPMPNTLPRLTDPEARAAADNFQAQLLRYRMLHRAQVQQTEIEDLQLEPAIRDQALTWLAPTCGCAQLKDAVLQAFSQRGREIAGSRFSDLRCVAAEAALFFCHKPCTTRFFIGELAQTMNDLLLGRHEEAEVSARKAGSLLATLGLGGERVTRGFMIELTPATRKRIHTLARAYRVLAMENGISRCEHCSGSETS